MSTQNWTHFGHFGVVTVVLKIRTRQDKQLNNCYLLSPLFVLFPDKIC